MGASGMKPGQEYWIDSMGTRYDFDPHRGDSERTDLSMDNPEDRKLLEKLSAYRVDLAALREQEKEQRGTNLGRRGTEEYLAAGLTRHIMGEVQAAHADKHNTQTPNEWVAAQFETGSPSLEAAIPSLTIGKIEDTYTHDDVEAVPSIVPGTMEGVRIDTSAVERKKSPNTEPAPVDIFMEKTQKLAEHAYFRDALTLYDEKLASMAEPLEATLAAVEDASKKLPVGKAKELQHDFEEGRFDDESNLPQDQLERAYLLSYLESKAQTQDIKKLAIGRAKLQEALANEIASKGERSQEAADLYFKAAGAFMLFGDKYQVEHVEELRDRAKLYGPYEDATAKARDKVFEEFKQRQEQFAAQQKEQEDLVNKMLKTKSKP